MTSAAVYDVVLTSTCSPEWLDFPREGNGNSFQYARRQFNVVDDHLLRYKYLNNFDSAMNLLEDRYKWLSDPHTYVSLKNETDRVIVFERGPLLFIFNWHPTKSYTDYRVGVEWPGKYKCVLNSDEKRFGGHDRIDLNAEYFTEPMEWNGRKNFLQAYLPTRTAIVVRLFRSCRCFSILTPRIAAGSLDFCDCGYWASGWLRPRHRNASIESWAADRIFYPAMTSPTHRLSDPLRGKVLFATPSTPLVARREVIERPSLASIATLNRLR